MSLEGKTTFVTNIVTGVNGDRQGDRGHASIHNSIGSVLNNLQDDVGIDNSVDTASLKYKVDNTANANRIKSKDVATPTTNGQFLKYNSSTDDLEWEVPAGAGDMLQSEYDAANVSEQLVGLTATQTLTNKRLTSPKLNEDVAITSTATELNVLDGIPATLTPTEIGYVDGVTSAIQTQLNAKAPLASPTFTGTVTLPTGLTGVVRTDSGVVSVDSDVTDIVAAASTTAAGKVEIAIASELNTGTDATRAVSPDSLAGSVFGEVVLQVVAVEFVTNITTGDGKFYIHVDDKLNGMDLVRCHAQVITAGTTNSTTIQIHNLTQAADMLTALLEVETGETGSNTSDPGPTIDTSNDDVATNDVLRIDVDSVSTTPPKGLIITMVFRLP